MDKEVKKKLQIEIKKKFEDRDQFKVDFSQLSIPTKCPNILKAIKNVVGVEPDFADFK